ncbi:MAG: hydrolase TatD [Gammaproteobacteria bacterium]|nr:hydrolase TatD [Gammaproteobacteria bacterium]
MATEPWYRYPPVSQYIDIGVNLTNKSLMHDLEAVLQRASISGVTQMVVTGTTLPESEAAIALCEQYPQQLVCTAGVHPHHASEWNELSTTVLISLSNHPCVRAIGETGLDFNRNYSPQDTQIAVFHQQLSIACNLGKPLFTHQRDAHDSFIDILQQYRNRLGAVVVHCFTDSKSALQDYLDLDCHIGITGWICDERRGTELQQIVKYIPDDRLMVETDAPYLLPRDLNPRPDSRINEPCHLPHIANRVAQCQGKTADRLADECLRTSRIFFNIQGDFTLQEQDSSLQLT